MPCELAELESLKAVSDESVVAECSAQKSTRDVWHLIPFRPKEHDDVEQQCHHDSGQAGGHRSRRHEWRGRDRSDPQR
jgi:hypothetical protein